MILFTGPEHATYVVLCRLLRLERDPAEPGDFAILEYAEENGPYVFGGRGHGWRHWKGFQAGIRVGPGDVWLPRLDQWLAMLEEAGVTDLVLRREAQGYFAANRRDVGQAHGVTREEAAARLWMAVAGREVRT